MRNINSLCTSSRFIDHVILMGFRDIFELLLDKDPRFEIKKIPFRPIPRHTPNTETRNGRRQRIFLIKFTANMALG